MDPFLSSMIGGVVAFGIGFGLGWYVKGRGLIGVKTDVKNAVATTESTVAAVKSA